jgi:hypothetical protein
MIRDNLRLTPAVYIPDEVAFLDRSPFDFYLAGSRYMGCARPDSDWDFYTQNTAEVRRYLAALGFKSVYAEYGAPESESTVDVWQARLGEFGELKVQVQLLRDVARTRTVRDIIKAHMLEQHIKMDREERAELWDTLHFALGLKAFGL